VTYADDGNLDTIDNLINFGKREQIANLVRDLLSYQKTCYEFKPKSELANLLRNLSDATDGRENVFWDRSKSLE
jgi:uncharacterized protein YjgD (DUF1641 family)